MTADHFASTPVTKPLLPFYGIIITDSDRELVLDPSKTKDADEIYETESVEMESRILEMNLDFIHHWAYISPDDSRLSWNASLEKALECVSRPDTELGKVKVEPCVGKQRLSKYLCDAVHKLLDILPHSPLTYYLHVLYFCSSSGSIHSPPIDLSVYEVLRRISLFHNASIHAVNSLSKQKSVFLSNALGVQKFTAQILHLRCPVWQGRLATLEYNSTDPTGDEGGGVECVTLYNTAVIYDHIDVDNFVDQNRRSNLFKLRTSLQSSKCVISSKLFVIDEFSTNLPSSEIAALGKFQLRVPDQLSPYFHGGDKEGEEITNKTRQLMQLEYTKTTTAILSAKSPSSMSPLNSTLNQAQWNKLVTRKCIPDSFDLDDTISQSLHFTQFGVESTIDEDTHEIGKIYFLAESDTSSDMFLTLYEISDPLDFFENFLPLASNELVSWSEELIQRYVDCMERRKVEASKAAFATRKQFGGTLSRTGRRGFENGDEMSEGNRRNRSTRLSFLRNIDFMARMVDKSLTDETFSSGNAKKKDDHDSLARDTKWPNSKKLTELYNGVYFNTDQSPDSELRDRNSMDMVNKYITKQHSSNASSHNTSGNVTELCSTICQESDIRVQPPLSLSSEVVSSKTSRRDVRDGSLSRAKTHDPDVLFTKKLRCAVYKALRDREVTESHTLFRGAFKRLFEICKLYTKGVPQRQPTVVKSSSSNFKMNELLNQIAMQNVDTVLTLERLNNK